MRIEPRIDELIGLGATATEILAAVDDLITAAAARGAVGLKTVLAYRTGLAVDPDADLAAADRSLREDLPVRRKAKPLRDLIFRRVLGRCADLRLPLQVHTGYGDSDLRLGMSHPLLLEEVLHTPEGTAATVVLIHGAFPWPDELAYLASVRPNVYAEISLSPLFSPARTADRLLRLLDTAPGARLLAGTDGHGHPETHWFAAHLLRDAVHRVRHELRDAGARDGWLDQVFDGLLQGNARRVYRLDPPVTAE
jgi:predicted TIM-barrel fold metal-dependent hydrolase